MTEFVNVHAPESADEFWTIFNRRGSENRELIATTKEQDSTNPCVSDYVVTMKERVVWMQQYANSASIVLPPYDVRRSQEIIEGFHKEVKEVEKSLIPKKKFAFSAKKKEVLAAESKVSADNADATTITVPAPSGVCSSSSGVSWDGGDEELIPAGCFVVLNKNDEDVHLEKDSLMENSAANQNIQLLFRNCHRDTYHITSLLGSVRIENASDCIIYLGPCCTSVYLENAQRCTLYIACHQLRIHKSNDCCLYVRVNGHPIIEDCANMGFAPYTYNYEGIDEDFKNAGLLTAACWDNVVDFRWHRTTQSPNWHLISESDRLNPHSYHREASTGACNNSSNINSSNSSGEAYAHDGSASTNNTNTWTSSAAIAERETPTEM